MNHVDRKNRGVQNLKEKTKVLSGSYIIIPTEVMEDKSLNSYDRILYGVLLNCVRKPGGGECHPGLDWLSERSGISRREVCRSIKRLCDVLWITYLRTKRSNNYQVYSPSEHRVSMYILKHGTDGLAEFRAQDALNSQSDHQALV
jgi:hypothetical protein